jgi:protoporphyrinogen oxidase
MENTDKKIAIIGAGPAGITAGYQLSKHTSRVDIYEAKTIVGGMAASVNLWDQIVDIGPHRFFSSDTRVNSLWLEVVGKDYRMVNRLTRILYKENFFLYPIKALDALSKLGIFEAVRCTFSFALGRLFPPRDLSTFEGWVTSRFGKRLYEIFFKTYSEKLWGINCKELDADFATQRIKKLSLWEAIKAAVLGDQAHKHKTLVDQFAYPLEGTGMVYSRMESLIKKKGGNVFLNSPVKKIITENNKAIGLELENGEIKKYDYIISSMPITLLVGRLEGVPQKVLDSNAKLRFRNTIIVYLHIDGKDLFPDNWLYVHSIELRMGRITNFRNWVPELYGNKETTILALEYWCYDDDDFWKMPDADLIELASKEIRHTGLIKDTTILEGKPYRIPRCYPVYAKGYKENLKPVEEYLAGIQNLSVIGRYGSFKYNNQDHSILMGILASENILNGAKHNLWEINTDYEDYQESSVITDTGLVKN